MGAERLRFALAAVLLLASCAQKQAVVAPVPAASAHGAPASYLTWTGVWKRPAGYYWGFDPSVEPGKGPAPKPPHRAEWLAKNDTQRIGEGGGGADSDCLPVGMPQMMNMVYLMELQANDQQLTIVSEYQSTIRRIYLDGRKHPEDFFANFNGHSVGRWEGETLVVDTVGLRTDTFVPHSDQMHVIERFRLIDADTIEDEVTVEDPVAFTKPWVVTKRFVREPDFEIGEYVCQENNRNPVSRDGSTGFVHEN